MSNKQTTRIEGDVYITASSEPSIYGSGSLEIDGTLTVSGGIVVAHSGLTGLLGDDHTQYALLAGRSGGQILTGGTISSDSLILRSTSNSTKGQVYIDETTASTSVTTGALRVDGGVGIGGTLYANAANITTLTAPHSGLSGLTADDHTQYSLLAGRSGGQTLTGGTAASNTLILRSTSNVTKGQVYIDETTISTSTITGALRVAGGVGIGGTLYANAANITTLTAPHSGLSGLTADDHTQYSLLAGRSGGQTLTGGTAASNTLILRSTSNATKGQVYIDETTASTSITTGALRVDGGVGIGGTLYANAANITTLTAPHSGLSGLTADDHTQYSLLAGRSGGQTLTGGTAASNTLILRSTSNATKGQVYIDETTASTSTTTGALRVAGGAGIAGTLYANAANITTLTAPHSGLTGLSADDHTQYSLLAGRSGGQTLTGGTAASNTLTLRSTSNATKGQVYIDETTASTSTTTGALRVDGGVGIGGTLYANAANITTLTAPHSGLSGLTADDHTQYSLLAGRSGGQTLTGGTAASNTLILRSTSNATKGQVYIDETTASTSTTTGALRVAGGIGIAGTLYANAANITTLTAPHSGLTGLSADDHTQYSLLAGRSGGQTLTGGTAASNTLILRSTSNATKGQVYIDETTSSTSTTTGALRVDGGVGIGGTLYANAANITTLTAPHSGLSGLSADDHTQYSLLAGRSGGQTLTGGTAASNTLILRSTSNITKGQVYIDETTASTSITTGALRVDGGVGIGGTLYANALVAPHSGLTGLTADDHTQYSLLAGRSGGQTLTGGTAASNTLILRSTSNATKGQVYIDETTASTSTTTGALRVAGGAGIAGTLYANAANITTLTAPHSGLTGLSADDHTQYSLLAGRLGGQTLIGGTAASNTLILRSTSNATKGQVYIDETTASTSTTTGALRVDGGVGIGGTLYANALVAPHSGLTGLTADDHTQYSLLAGRSGGQTLTGGTAASNTLILRSTTNATKGQVYIDETTASTSTITGALRVDGGVGIGGTLYANAANITTLTAPHSGLSGLTADDHTQYSLLAGRSGGQTLTGGTAASNTLTLRSTSNATKGQVYIDETTASTSTTTGALRVAGGVGIGGTLYANAANITTLTAPHSGLSGLSADDHTQYSLLAGRSGGQTLTGGTAASNTLILRSTSNATKGQVYIDETTASTSVTTGALRVDGGVGIGGTLYANALFGQTLTGGTTASNNLVLRSTSNVSKGQVYIDETTPSTSITTGALRVDGGVGIGGTLYANALVAPHSGLTGLSADDHTQYSLLAGRSGGQTLTGGTAASNTLILRSTSNATKGQVYIDETTASTSTTTGALRVDGGVGIGGTLYANAANITTLTAPHSGLSGLSSDDHTQYSLLAGRSGGQTLTGGTAASNTLTLRSTSNATKGQVYIDETTASTSTTTGALRVAGGVGIAGTLYVNAANITTLTAPHSGLSGLTADDHTQYSLLAGRSGGQTLTGGTAASNTLTLRSTSNATKGQVYIDETTASTSVTTGALRVDGGVGIGGTLYVNAANITTLTAPHSGLSGLTADDHTQYSLLAGRSGGQTLTGGTAASNILTLRSTSNATKGQVYIDETTASTSVTTGALRVDGGVGVGGTLYANGLFGQTLTGGTTASNNLTLRSTSNATKGQVYIDETTASTSITSGALRVDGGVGIGGTLYANAANITTLTAPHSGLSGLTADDHTQYSLLAGRSGGQTLTGGTAASNTLTLRSTSNATKGQVYIDETTASTSTTTGALRVAGGVGIGGTLYANAANITTLTAPHSGLSGLSADDHTQYSLLAGRSGGQTLTGGIAASNTLTLRSTSNATKGQVYIDETTASTSVTSGALRVDGGVGIGGTLYANAANITTLTAPHSGLSGLSADDHTQYSLLAGRSGGQTLTGGTAASNTLTLRSTSNVTKGQVYIDETTASTSVTTGALRVDGGVGIGGTLYANAMFGQTLTGGTTASNNLTLRSTSNVVKGQVYIDETTASTSITTGALRVDGGVGIGGTLYANAANITTLTAPHSGLSGLSADDHTQYSLLAGRSGGQTLTGGTAASNTLTLRSTSNATKGQVYIDETTASTSTTTGALRVAGGVGIAGTLYANAANITTLTAPHSGLSGLSADDHTQYSLLAGRSGGQTLTGGTAASNTLTLRSTSNATKGQVYIDETTASTSVTSGALRVDGGVGIGGTLYANAANITTLTAPHSGLSGLSADDHTQYSLLAGRSGGQTLTGGTAASNTLTLRSTSNATKGQVYIDETTASTSTTTGALRVAGGVGIGGTLYANAANITTLTAPHSGLSGLSADDHTQYSLLAGRSGGQTLTGGTAASNTLILRSTTNATKGQVYIDETTASTSVTTGALRVAGGVGIGGSLYAGDIYSNGVLVSSSSYIAGTNIDITTSVISVISNPSFSGIVSITNSTSSTNNITGALTLSGGIAISNTTDSSSSTVGGTLTTAGGIAVAKQLFVGTNAIINNYIQLNNITTPANPAANNYRLYFDTSTNLLTSTNSVGALTTYQPITSKGDLATFGTTTQQRLPVGNNNDRLIADSTQTLGLRWVPSFTYFYIRDEKTSGTNGGTATSGAFATRTLNQITEYPSGNTTVTLSTNIVTFSAGTYYIFARAPVSGNTGAFTTRLFDTTNNITIAFGSSSRSSGNGSDQDSVITTTVTFATSTTIALQMRVAATVNNTGLGVANGFQTEVYAMMNVCVLQN